MNKIYLVTLTLFALLVSSCSQELPNINKETNPDNISISEALVTTKEYTVPVVEDYITTVTYNGKPNCKKVG